MDNLKNLENIFLKGITEELYYAQRNYFVFRMIGENSESLNKALTKQNTEAAKLKYLQMTAHDSAVLYLAKYFDVQKGNRNHCLRGFLNLIELELPDNFEPPAYLNSAELDQLIKLEGQNRREVESLRDVVIIIRNVLNKKNTKRQIKQVKTIRDKVIAHKDKIESITSNITRDFWQSYEGLLYLARLYNHVIGYHFFATHINNVSIDPEHVIDDRVCIQMYWLEKELTGILGSENLVYTMPQFSNFDK